jgi:hypothetical protein
MTYILGVYDAVQIVQYHAPAAERYFCAPPGLTGKDAATLRYATLPLTTALRLLRPDEFLQDGRG